MEGIFGCQDEEKSLYLTQIRYLEEQLERCQLQYDELEEKNKDLTSQYSALEKDKKDATKYLKRCLAAKEKKVEELNEQLKVLQQAAGQDTEILRLQHGLQRKELQDQIDGLTSEIREQAAKCVEQQELQKKIQQLRQELSITESLKKHLLSVKEEHEADILIQKNAAEAEKERNAVMMQNIVKQSMRNKTAEILGKERAHHRKRQKTLQFLKEENLTLPTETDILQDKDQDLCFEKDQLKKELGKISHQNIACKKAIKRLKEEHQELSVKLKDASATYDSILTDIKASRQRLTSLSEESHQITAEATQLTAELQRERTRIRQLEGVLHEGVIILHHILTGSEKEAQWAAVRLLEILESVAPQGPADPKPARPRPKVRLLNHDGPLTLNCRHHLKISEPHSEERRSPVQAEDNRRCRRELQAQQPAHSDMMELYLDLHSQPCRSVFLFAKAVGIPFEFKLVDLSAGHQYSEEFGKISVMRKVPVMKDGSFVLTESTAILKYLVQKHAALVADHWFPAGLQQRARVNEYLSWQHMNLRAHGSKVFLLRALFPIIMGSEAPKEKMDAAIEDLNQSTKMLEEKFLEDKPFIIGDKISLADLVAIVEIMQPAGTGLDVFEGRPKLMAWRERVKTVLGEKLFDEAHDVIMKVSSLPQKMQGSSNLEMLKPKFRKLFS